MIYQTIEDQLTAAQARARARTMNAAEAWDIAQHIAAALIDAPAGTEIKGGLHDHLPGNYGYPADATYVAGAKRAAGVEIQVRRDNGGFGRRRYLVRTPAGYVARGKGVHASSGAANFLDDMRIERQSDAEAAMRRCAWCEVVGDHTLVADVPGEARLLCRACAEAEGFSVNEAADGTIGLVRREFRVTTTPADDGRGCDVRCESGMWLGTLRGSVGPDGESSDAFRRCSTTCPLTELGITHVDGRRAHPWE